MRLFGRKKCRISSFFLTKCCIKTRAQRNMSSVNIKYENRSKDDQGYRFFFCSNASRLSLPIKNYGLINISHLSFPLLRWELNYLQTGANSVIMPLFAVRCCLKPDVLTVFFFLFHFVIKLPDVMEVCTVCICVGLVATFHQSEHTETHCFKRQPPWKVPRSALRLYPRTKHPT